MADPVVPCTPAPQVCARTAPRGASQPEGLSCPILLHTAAAAPHPCQMGRIWCWFCVSLPASASRCVRPGRSQVTKKSDFRGRLAVFYYTRNEASPEKTLNYKYANSDLGVCFGFFLHFIIENIRYAQKCRASDCVPVTTIT